MSNEEMIKMQESYWPVICPYCHEKMEVRKMEFLDPIWPDSYNYYCKCGTRSPDAATPEEAYDLAFTYNHQLVEAKNIEYQRGFEDGYKSGRERGHGFSY